MASGPKRSAKPKARPRRILIVAHPDDETLLFSSILQRKRDGLKVICVTDGNADGKGAAREREFVQALALQGVKDHEFWHFKDVFEQRLDQARLTSRLEPYADVREVYTHGPYGEYGHPHHQDVSRAVHAFFSKRKAKVWSPAYNTYPEVAYRLTLREFTVKSKALIEVYRGETRRFLQTLPNTHTEGFLRIGERESAAIFESLVSRTPPDPKALKAFKWYLPHGASFHLFPPERPF